MTTLVDSYLEEALQRHLERPHVPVRLRESIRYSLFGPGKRIRPRLCLAAAKLMQLPEPAARAAAVALEFVHCFTLIHDDLPCMDNDDFRRGRPSNHRKFDEGTALLAGDALQTLAWEALIDAHPAVSAERVIAASRRFMETIGPRGVVGGQIAESTLGTNSRLEDLRRMHAMKTGALFEASLLIPMDLAGVLSAEPRGQALHAFARALGAAFQILDDLDDAIQDQARTPVNILYYLDESQSRALAQDELSSGLASLEKAWGTQECGPLREIAEEILNLLRTPTTAPTLKS